MVDLNRVDLAITRWMARVGIVLLRVSLGIVFLWFGALKFLPGASPAQELATRTIYTLSGGLVAASVSLPVLAGWECVIGLGLLVGGGQPREQLHFVYAVVALGALPVTDSLSRGFGPRARGLATLVGALVALAVIARLFGTG